jgi:predicted PurR-regulated permease PerM
MNQELRFPLYVRFSLLLIAIYLSIDMLIIAQSLILPLVFAVIIGILMSPAVNFLNRKGIHRTLAIGAVLLLTICIIAGLIIVVSLQSDRMAAALPQLSLKFHELLNSMVVALTNRFDLDATQLYTWLENLRTEIISASGNYIGSTLNTVGGIVAAAVLTPVYTFMILLYQPHLVLFIHKLFGSDNDKNINEILTETRVIVRSYLVGLFIEISIVAVLNVAGLMIIGIEYALILGLIGALLNVIPYLGAIIAMTIFMLIALITKTPMHMLYVLVMYGIIQFLDNNILVPKIIGSKVRLNALTSILAVIAGAAIWGIPGMFLSIPITAIVKLILDRVESLKVWGFLLGDTSAPFIRLRMTTNRDRKK